MPELPEIETIRTYLIPHLIGKQILSIQIQSPKQFIGNSNDIIGSSIIEVRRIGKILSLRLSNHKYLNFHLKMSGQLLLNPKSVNLNHQRIIIELSNENKLIFVDIRKFGWIKVTNEQEGIILNDVLSPTFTLLYFTKKIKSSRKPIKSLIMDQSIVAGIGNIYANDSLFEAGIDPRRLSSTLSESEAEKLYEAIKNIILEGIQYKGSSATHIYRLPDNTTGKYQERFRVYGREGKPCQRCHAPIKRIVIGGRSTFYCPLCQR